MPQISPFKTDLIYVAQEDVVKIFNNVWEPQWILAGTFRNMRKRRMNRKFTVVILYNNEKT